MGGTRTPSATEQQIIVAVAPPGVGPAAGPHRPVSDVGAIRPAPGVCIPLGELEWRYSPAGGPGGQHANTSNTRADVRFDITASPSLTPEVRNRLLDRLGPFVEAGAGERRSQLRNRELAVERLTSRLAAALVVERSRRATRPTRASTRRRLDAKRRHSETKRSRRIGGDDS